MVALLAPGTARSQPALITQPVWLERPSAEDFARRYPEIAQIMNIEAVAVTSCQVDKEGRLKACAPVSAKPAGLGFEQGTLASIAQFRMAPNDAGGQPVEGRPVRVPLRFVLPKFAGSPSPPPTLIEGAIPESAREIVRLTGAARRMYPNPEPSLLKVAQRGGDGTEPQALADGMAAVRLADAESQNQWEEALARALATRLSPAELDQLLANLKAPAAAAPADPESAIGKIARGQDPIFKAMTADAQRRIGQAYVARVREIFCKARDCGPEPTPKP